MMLRCVSCPERQCANRIAARRVVAFAILAVMAAVATTLAAVN